MKRQEIYNQIVKILKDCCNIQRDDIGEQLSFEEDLGLESMGLLTLAVEIENHWQLFLDESQDPPRTVGELVDLVQQRLSEKNNLGTENA